MEEPGRGTQEPSMFPPLPGKAILLYFTQNSVSRFDLALLYRGQAFGITTSMDDTKSPFFLNNEDWEFPGSPVVKIPYFQCMDHGFPWSGH